MTLEIYIFNYQRNIRTMEKKTNEINSTTKFENGSYWYFFHYNLLPKIVGFILVCISFVPAAIISMVYTLLIGPGEKESTGIADVILVFVVISCIIISTWWWLHYLEEKTKMDILIPIPFVRIRLKWVLFPFIFPFLGIRWLFRKADSTHK
jgi:hypothetical protein